MTMNPFMIACTYITEIGGNMNVLMAVDFFPLYMEFLYVELYVSTTCLWHVFMMEM